MTIKWLIERTDLALPTWLTNDEDGFLWTAEATNAQNYSTEANAKEAWLAAQDLDEELARFHLHVKVTEHQFG